MSLKELLAEWPAAPLVPCKGCGKKILFVKTYDGKTIPLDPSPPVYMVLRQFSEETRCKQISGYVSHFSTCSSASTFSSSNKKEDK